MTPSEQMARIWDTERTVIVDRAEYEALRAALAEERAIVDRIWRQLGSPTYEQLAGRSIYDLIDELKQRAFSAPLEKEPSFDRDDLIELALHAMDNVHDMDVPWRVYAAAVVDALIEEGAIKLEGK
jgi:hypothetical protein